MAYMFDFSGLWEPSSSMSDEIQIMPSTLEGFLADIIQHEKRYAHNERGAKNERRSKVVEKVEETAARELDKK
jgi:hypothetical protein